MQGFQYGTRPLPRAIRKYMEDPLAEEILKANIPEGDTIVVDPDTEAKDKLRFDIKKKCKKATK